MRTSLDLPDETYRRLKILAAERGTTLKQMLRTAVENELSGIRRAPRPYRIKAPLLDSRRPGTLRLTNDEIEDLLT